MGRRNARTDYTSGHIKITALIAIDTANDTQELRQMLESPRLTPTEDEDSVPVIWHSFLARALAWRPGTHRQV